MATINGVEFNLVSIVFDTNNRNVLGRSAGSKTNPISNYGMDGLTISLTGEESTVEDYDAVISEFMSNGSELIIWAGWKYDIYSTSNNLAEQGGFAGKDFPYRFDLVCSDPYQYSTSETTRTKTITVNNQEWSADDSANDITTSGTVEAVPDIEIEGAVTGDYNREGVLIEETDDTDYTVTVDVYELKYTHTMAAKSNTAYNLLEVKAKLKGTATGGSIQVRYLIAGGGENTLVTWTNTETSLTQETHTCDINTANNESLVIRYYAKRNGVSHIDTDDAYHKTQELLQAGLVDVDIYNTADTTVKCNVANTIYNGMTVRINVDGAGTIQLIDDFTTNTFLGIIYDSSGITYNAGTDDISLADDAYMYYLIDTKYPITGIPSLLSTIDITAGTPTIQISADGSTWYDLDSAIVDDVETTYELDNATNLSLKGLTSFYFRFDCGGAGTNTCTVKSLELNIIIVTIDAEHPEITTGAANTFRCDQDAESGLNCEVSLIYRDRKWPS